MYIIDVIELNICAEKTVICQGGMVVFTHVQRYDSRILCLYFTLESYLQYISLSTIRTANTIALNYTSVVQYVSCIHIMKLYYCFPHYILCSHACLAT